MSKNRSGSGKKGLLALGGLVLIGVGAFFSYGLYSETLCACTTAGTAGAEMRNLSVAIENYRANQGVYPMPAGKDSWEPVPFKTTGAAGYTPRTLTTPTVYLALIPDDATLPGWRDEAGSPSMAYRYATIPDVLYVMAANGPDEDVDIPLEEWISGANPGSPTGFFSHLGGKWPLYDPSNGTNSNGDVLRWGP